MKHLRCEDCGGLITALSLADGSALIETRMEATIGGYYEEEYAHHTYDCVGSVEEKPPIAKEDL